MSRVLIIGLDSADAELIERWCDEGHLPTFAALRREGLWTRLGTTAEVMHVSAWPTIYTSTTPGHHGLYHAYQVRGGKQEIIRTSATDGMLPPFWKYLDDAGKSCIVMDAFLDRRLPDFRGTQITEYGTWTWFSEPSSVPASARRELLRRFGPYPAPEHTHVLTVPDPVWFRDKLAAGARQKGEVTRWLLRERPWEMAFVTFGEPHGAGHYLWHFSDEEYPSHVRVPGAEHALRDVYVAVDEAIGAILSEVDRDTTVMVTSGDGMGPNYAGCHLLPDVLHRLGHFHGAGVGAPAADTAAAKPKRGLTSTLRHAIPLSWRRAVTQCLPRSVHYRMAMKWVNAGIDFDRSRAYCIPNANEGYIRINRQGREPRGLVAPGSAYQDLVAELDGRINELMVPGNGRQAVHQTFRVDDVYPGPARDNLPDLVVTWDLDARILADLESPACGLIHRQGAYEASPYYTGNHRATAFLVARGPGVPAGRGTGDTAPDPHTVLRGITGAAASPHILDIAPTVLALLGVEPPSHFQGRVWTELTG